MNLVKERLAQKLEENKDKISTLKLKAAASLENVKGTLKQHAEQFLHLRTSESDSGPRFRDGDAVEKRACCRK